MQRRKVILLGGKSQNYKLTIEINSYYLFPGITL